MDADGGKSCGMPLALLRQKTAVAEFRAEKRSRAEPREARWGPGHVPGWVKLALLHREAACVARQNEVLMQ